MNFYSSILLSPLRRSQLNSKNYLLCLRFFYLALVLTDLVFFVWVLPQKPIELMSPLWPVTWIPRAYTEPTLYLLASSIIILHLYNALYPFRRLAKIFSTLLFFIMIAAFFSFGKISNYLHGALFCSLWFCTLNGKDYEKDKINFAFGQASFLTAYLASGLWKSRQYFINISEYGLGGFDSLKNTFALNQIESFKIGNSWLYDMPGSLSQILWITIILWEVSILFLCFIPRIQILVGISLFLFHLSTFLFMGLPYLPHPIIVLILFCMNVFNTKDPKRLETS